MEALFYLGLITGVIIGGLLAMVWVTWLMNQHDKFN